MPVYPWWVRFVDDKGYSARVNLWTNQASEADAQTAAANIFPFLFTMSGANAQSAGGVLGITSLALQYGSTNPYQSIADRARFVFADHVGLYHRIELPAPSALIFLADGETLDLSNADVTNFVNAMISNNACGRAGALIETILGGNRVRKKMPRKISGINLGPDLTLPA